MVLDWLLPPWARSTALVPTRRVTEDGELEEDDTGVKRDHAYDDDDEENEHPPSPPPSPRKRRQEPGPHAEEADLTSQPVVTRLTFTISLAFPLSPGDSMKLQNFTAMMNRFAHNEVYDTAPAINVEDDEDEREEALRQEQQSAAFDTVDSSPPETVVEVAATTPSPPPSPSKRKRAPAEDQENCFVTVIDGEESPKAPAATKRLRLAHPVDDDEDDDDDTSDDSPRPSRPVTRSRLSPLKASVAKRQSSLRVHTLDKQHAMHTLQIIKSAADVITAQGALDLEEFLSKKHPCYLIDGEGRNMMHHLFMVPATPGSAGKLEKLLKVLLPDNYLLTRYFISLATPDKLGKLPVHYAMEHGHLQAALALLKDPTAASYSHLHLSSLKRFASNLFIYTTNRTKHYRLEAIGHELDLLLAA